MGDERRTDLTDTPGSGRQVAGSGASSAALEGMDAVEAFAGALGRLHAERYQLREELGRGGMGAVHRLRDRALLREVAMKSTQAAGVSDAARLILDEAQLSACLEHPHIVPVHDVGLTVDGEAVYFTMKLVKGETLAEVVGGLHGAPWNDRDVERCLQVIIRVCDALAFSHSRGIVHRDVKPSNVMVGSFGQVYLMDWGVAVRVTGSADTADATDDPGVHGAPAAAEPSTGSRAGTPEYMAPEQMRGEIDRIDARTDVYGVGGLLYFLLTAREPNAVAYGRVRPEVPEPVAPPPERSAWPKLPPELVRIAMRALAFEPDDRYATVTDLKDDLEEFLRGGGWFETRRYTAGSVIVEQGDAAREAYMIMRGECEVTQTVDGKTHPLRTMGPGDVFGETAILTDGPRTATVVAATDVVVKVVSRDDFVRELNRSTWLGAFVRAIAERFRDVDAQLAKTRKG